MTERASPDVVEWTNELKRRKIMTFEFKDLPLELKSKKMLVNSAICEHIVKVKKSDKGRILWRVVK